MSSNDNNKDMKIDSTSSDELCWCHFCKGYPIPTDSFPHLCCIRDVSDMFGTADSDSESESEEEDERYCDNEKCPSASYICFEELEKYRGKPWVCTKCIDDDEEDDEEDEEE